MVETVLQRAGRALSQETVDMILQRNSELALNEPRYSGGIAVLPSYLKHIYI
jgi:hypothetical protein